MTHPIILAREVNSAMKLFVRKLAHRYVKKTLELALAGTDLVPAVRAAITSHEFESRYLRDVPFYRTRKDLYAAALAQARIAGGLNLEFGVYKADSINLLAKLAPERKFVGFDSFEGLPEAWTLGARKAAFDIGGKLPPVRSNVTLVKGFFEDSLPGFCAQHPGATVAFLHIDCDLYSATRTVLEQLRAMLHPGTIVVFDELYNYTEWLDHEYKAWTEFAEAQRVRYTYIGYIRTGSQVALRIDALGAD